MAFQGVKYKHFPEGVLQEARTFVARVIRNGRHFFFFDSSLSLLIILIRAIPLRIHNLNKSKGLFETTTILHNEVHV